LDVVFDVCVVNFIITGVCKGSATIDPSKANWVFGSADNVLAVITTNCPGNTVVSINDTETGIGGDWLTSPTNYVVADNGDGSLNLTVNKSWLATELYCVGATTKLTINMTRCNDIFLTITAVAAPVPSISPSTLSYCVGGCCGNVCATIDWAGATAITSVYDITSPQAAVPLYTNIEYALPGFNQSDYWIRDNTTLILNGCKSWSSNASQVYLLTGGAVNRTLWGGLVCELDGGVRLARIIKIVFNDSCKTEVILTVNAACTTPPSITPTEIAFDLDAWKCDVSGLVTAKVGAVISLGTSSGINYVEDVTLSECCGTPLYPTGNPKHPNGANLTPLYQWMQVYAPAYGGWLLVLLRDTYIVVDDATAAYIGSTLNVTMVAGANLTSCSSQPHTIMIHWLPLNEDCCASCFNYVERYLPTKVTLKPVSLGASICPVKADFNIDSPAGVKTEITWGNWVTNLTEIRESKCSIPVLADGIDYTLDHVGNCTNPSVLTITDTYLKKVLKEVGDQAVLTVYFDTCGTATFTITATGTPMCFIATAAGADAPQLDILRAFRDDVLRPNAPWLVSLYYEVSPSIANVIADNEALKWLVKNFIVDPAACIVGLWAK